MARLSFIVHADNMAVLPNMRSRCVRLIYIDPPFNTGKRQALRSCKTVADDDGDRTGFGGKRYSTTVLGEQGYDDRYDDYLDFLARRLGYARHVLTNDGSIFVHIDPRESHYVKLLLDKIFGRECFMGEIVWAYDFGGRSRKRWSAKHDLILWYVKHPDDYIWNQEAYDQLELPAPGLPSDDRIPGDVWWRSIVGTNSRERTGYPTQKPVEIIERIIAVHSRPGDAVLDLFAGSGTTGVAALRLGRRFILVDESEQAFDVMTRRIRGMLEPNDKQLIVIDDAKLKPERCWRMGD